MSLLDQSIRLSPEPWQDRDWAKFSGMPLEDVCFQAADGERLFDWHAEAQGGSDCPSSIFNYHGTGGVREDHQRKASTEGAFNSTFQLRFLEAIRQLVLSM